MSFFVFYIYCIKFADERGFLMMSLWWRRACKHSLREACTSPW